MPPTYLNGILIGYAPDAPIAPLAAAPVPPAIAPVAGAAAVPAAAAVAAAAVAPVGAAAAAAPAVVLGAGSAALGLTDPNWEGNLASLVDLCPSKNTVIDMARGMARMLGSNDLFASLFTAARVQLPDGRRVTMGLQKGEERSDAIEAFYHTLAPHLVATSAPVNAMPAVAALHELYQMLAPDPPPGSSTPNASTGMGGAPVADSTINPQEQLARQLARQAREEEKEDKEMSTKDTSRRLELLVRQHGVFAPDRGSICHAQQLRKLHTDIVKNGLVHSDESLEPNKIKASGGDDGVKAAKACKDADVEANDAADSLEYRARVKVLINSIGVVAAGEKDGEAIYEGALRVLQALNDAVQLSSLALVSSAVESGFRAARRARNRGRGDRTTIGDAYAMAAMEIERQNENQLTAKRQRADEEKPTGAAKGGGSSLSETEIEQMIAKAADKAARKSSRKGAATNANGKKKDSKPVDIGSGTMRFYKVVKGGNLHCPVACTKTHAKADECEYHHKDK